MTDKNKDFNEMTFEEKYHVVISPLIFITIFFSFIFLCIFTFKYFDSMDLQLAIDSGNCNEVCVKTYFAS